MVGFWMLPCAMHTMLWFHQSGYNEQAPLKGLFYATTTMFQDILEGNLAVVIAWMIHCTLVATNSYSSN